MSEDSTTEAQLWAYVHGELSPEDRQQVERIVGLDPDQKAQLQAIRRCHEQLQAGLSKPCMTTEQLEARVAQALDANVAEAQAMGSPSELSSSPMTTESRSRSPLMAYWRPVLALAASLVLAIGIHHATRPDLLWETPVIASVAFRGAEDVEARYSEADLQRACRLVRKAVEDAHSELIEGGDIRDVAKWRLAIRAQELHEGAFSLYIEARKRGKPEGRCEWSLDFTGMADFEARLTEVGRRVAQGLVAPEEPRISDSREE